MKKQRKSLTNLLFFEDLVYLMHYHVVILQTTGCYDTRELIAISSLTLSLLQVKGNHYEVTSVPSYLLVTVVI